MKYIEENREEFFKLAERRKGKIIKKNKLNNKARKIDYTTKFLETVDQDMTVEVLVKKLKKDLKDIDKKAKEIEI